ncbi:MAG: lipopolysaccharide transport periplasmic protein LptA [Desulfamplus sp.]|nr:lipopolysaccharide transport periplasmic protein LptA [Desulfamplus sp.]
MLTLFYKNIFILFIIILSIIPNATCPIFASDNGKPNRVSAPQEAAKLHITSDSMMVEKEPSMITFSGNVVATQGESVIKADSILVHLFTESEKKAIPTNSNQEIKSLTASGNVRFSSGNKTAYADKAVYTSTDQKIVLTGDSPRVTTGDSYITGKVITLFQESGKVMVEGGKERRVEALFNSQDDFKQNKSKSADLP